MVSALIYPLAPRLSLDLLDFLGIDGYESMSHEERMKLLKLRVCDPNQVYKIDKKKLKALRMQKVE